jgi:hypothetical protein
MAYSEELIAEVKEVYPDHPRMYELAKEGSVWLGRYLDDASSSSIPIETILRSTSLEELQNMAKLLKKKLELYNKWCKEDPRKAEKSL